MDAAKIGGEKAGLFDSTHIPRWSAGPSTYVHVNSISFFILGKTKVHTTLSREEAQPHFGKNSEPPPGPSEKPALGKQICDSGNYMGSGSKTFFLPKILTSQTESS